MHTHNTLVAANNPLPRAARHHARQRDPHGLDVGAPHRLPVRGPAGGAERRDRRVPGRLGPRAVRRARRGAPHHLHRGRHPLPARPARRAQPGRARRLVAGAVLLHGSPDPAGHRPRGPSGSCPAWWCSAAGGRPRTRWSPSASPATRTRRLIDTDGYPWPGMRIRVVDESGAELPPGTDGRLQVTGPFLFVGYAERLEMTRALFDGEWFDTGDLAHVDAEGYLSISGRTKDVIIRGGENIPVAYVENVLYEHPQIQEVAVVGLPDPRLQERACACVVPVAGAELTFDDIKAVPRREGGGQAVLARAPGGPSPSSPAPPAARSRSSGCASRSGTRTMSNRLSGRRGAHPVRPVRRRAGAGAAGRPRRPRAPRAQRSAAVGRLGRAGRRPARLRQSGRRGQPQRRPDGHPAGRPAGIGAGRDGEPALRVQPGHRRDGRPRRPVRRCRPRPGRRGGEHDPSPVRHTQGRIRVLPGHRDPRHHHRMAVRQPGDGRTVRHRLHARDRRERRGPSTGSPEKTRTRSRSDRRNGPPRRSHRAGWPGRSRRCRSRSAAATTCWSTGTNTRGRPPSRRWPKLRPIAPGGTVTAGNASGINDGAAAVLIASERAVQRYGLDPAGPGHLRRRGRRPTPGDGHRTGRVHPQAVAPQRVEDRATSTWSS